MTPAQSRALCRRDATWDGAGPRVRAGRLTHRIPPRAAGPVCAAVLHQPPAPDGGLASAAGQAPLLAPPAARRSARPPAAAAPPRRRPGRVALPAPSLRGWVTTDPAPRPGPGHHPPACLARSPGPAAGHQLGADRAAPHRGRDHRRPARRLGRPGRGHRPAAAVDRPRPRCGAARPARTATPGPRPAPRRPVPATRPRRPAAARPPPSGPPGDGPSWRPRWPP